MMAVAHPVDTIDFKKTALAVFLIICALGALIYGNSLLAPFFLDDTAKITENPQIRMTRLTRSQLERAGQGQPVARLLPLTTFAVNYYFHRYRVEGYRLVNFFIHFINAWLIFCLAWLTLRRIGRPPFLISLLAALFWLTQPLHIQSVTYIVQRINSLAALFYLSSLICYILARMHRIDHRPRAGAILLFAGCGLAGLLGLVSRQTTATLPMFLFLYEWYFFQNLSRNWLRQRRPRLGLVLILSAMIAVFYLTAHPFERLFANYAGKPFSLTDRLLTEPRVVLYYLSLLFYPHPDRLMLRYDFPLSTALLDPAVTLPALAALAALLALAVFAAKKHRLLSFAILWYLGNLAIESSVIPLAPVFEHRTYLPWVFPSVAAAACLIGHVPPRPLAVAILSGLILCNGFWTYQRNLTWQGRITFWRDACAKAPGLANVHNDYGLALDEAGDLKAAAVQYKKALALPAGENAPAHNNLGMLYYQTGDLDAAERQFLLAIQAQPTFAKAFINLGVVKAEKGNPMTAVRLFEAAVSLDPDNADAHNALAKAYYETGRTEAAVTHCRRALQLDPNNINAENNLGAMLLGTGRPDRALPHLARVLELSPDHFEANMNIGLAYDRLDNPVMAVFHLFRAVFLAPDNADARTELGLFLLEKGKYPDARTQLEEALRLRPDLAKARQGLMSLLKIQGLREADISRYLTTITDNPDNAAAEKRPDRLPDQSENETHEP